MPVLVSRNTGASIRPRGVSITGRRLAGDRLVDGEYRPIELTTEPDGILKGYSEVLELSLCWDANWPRFYDPATDTYLESWQQDRVARRGCRSAGRRRAGRPAGGTGCPPGCRGANTAA